MSWLFFLFWLVALVIAARFRPTWATLAVIIGSPLYLLRTDILGIPTTALELGIYALAIIFVINWVRQHWLAAKLLNFYNLFKPYRWPLLLWLGFTLISAVLSPEWRLSFGILKGWFFDPLLLVLLLTSLADRSDVINFRDLAAYGLTGAALIITIYGFYDYFWGYTFETGRLDAFYTSPNYAAMFLTPVLFISLGLLWQHWQSRRRLLCLLSTALILLALALTGSFGGYAAGLVGLLVGAALVPMNSLKRLTAVLVIILISASLLASGLIDVRGHYNQFFKISSWQIRAQLWQAGFVLTTEQPIWGVGLGRFQRELPRLVAPQGTLSLPADLLQFHLPHNLYLTISSESGGIALLGFLWFAAWWLWRNYRAYKSSPQPLLWAALAALAVMLIHGLVDTPYFKNDLSLLWWLVILLGLRPATKEVSQNSSISKSYPLTD